MIVATPCTRTVALRSCWHPVARSRGVGGEPYALTLLDEPVAVWRDGAGTAHAFKDLCIHPGTALSPGAVQGGEIVCPCHGWRYGADGACTAIPQHEDTSRVPLNLKARAEAHACLGRYGPICVALVEPARWQLPGIPEMENPAWRTVAALDPAATWEFDAVAIACRRAMAATGLA